MAKIQNSDVITEMIKGLFLDPARERVPSEVADKILAVYNVNPIRKNTILSSNSRTTTAAAITFFTANAKRDTYLTGAWLQNVSDVSANNVTMFIEVELADGLKRNILISNKITLTVFDTNTFITFPPILLKKGATVKLTNVFTLGVSVTTYGLLGYETETQ